VLRDTGKTLELEAKGKAMGPGGKTDEEAMPAPGLELIQKSKQETGSMQNVIVTRIEQKKTNPSTIFQSSSCSFELGGGTSLNSHEDPGPSASAISKAEGSMLTDTEGAHVSIPLEP
jgi:hypothetical protein